MCLYRNEEYEENVFVRKLLIFVKKGTNVKRVGQFS